MLVYIFGHSQEVAGKMVGVAQQKMSDRLARLKEMRPELFPTQREKTLLRKKLTYYPSMDCDVVKQY